MKLTFLLLSLSLLSTVALANDPYEVLAEQKVGRFYGSLDKTYTDFDREYPIDLYANYTTKTMRLVYINGSNKDGFPMSCSRLIQGYYPSFKCTFEAFAKGVKVKVTVNGISAKPRSNNCLTIENPSAKIKVSEYCKGWDN